MEETREEIKRVVIELTSDDYEFIRMVKSFVGLEWRELLIKGVLAIIDDFGGEEKFIEALKTALGAAKRLTEKE